MENEWRKPWRNLQSLFLAMPCFEGKWKRKFSWGSFVTFYFLVIPSPSFRWYSTSLIAKQPPRDNTTKRKMIQVIKYLGAASNIKFFWCKFDGSMMWKHAGWCCRSFFFWAYPNPQKVGPEQLRMYIYASAQMPLFLSFFPAFFLCTKQLSLFSAEMLFFFSSPKFLLLPPIKYIESKSQTQWNPHVHWFMSADKHK